MKIEDFSNGFRAYQGDNYHFTSDAIHLAKFVIIKKSDCVLEFCAGSGVIGLYANSMSECKSLTFVELQKDMCEIISKNIELNSVNNATVINADINKLSEENMPNKFDCIIANPPYEPLFMNTPLQKDNAIALSRHEVALTLQQLIEKCALFMTDKGRLYIVHKASRLCELVITLNKYRFEVKRIQLVYADGKEPHIALVEAVKGGKSGVRVSIKEASL